MPKYLRSAEDRKRAILNDEPDTKFHFESQKFSDLPWRPEIDNYWGQYNSSGAREVRKNDALIEAAAKRYAIDPDIVRAIIYTEVARGDLYGHYAEMVHLARTILPSNINTDWQKLIPGSDVHKVEDNIGVATKLIAGIARRLDDPSIENIYSLYNSLAHDRTYANKEVKSTPYFAKLAFENRAWEKDDWSTSQLPKDVSGVPLSLADSHGFEARLGRWAIGPMTSQDPPASFSDRYGAGGFLPWKPAGAPTSPIARELLKYQFGPGAGSQGILPPVRPGELLNEGKTGSANSAVRIGPSNEFPSAPASDPRGRSVDGAGRCAFETGVPAVPFIPNVPLAPRPPSSFVERYGSFPGRPMGLSFDQVATTTRPARPSVPRKATDSVDRTVAPAGTFSGEPLLYPFPPIFDVPRPAATPGDDMNDWFTRWVKPLMQQ